MTFTLSHLQGPVPRKMVKFNPGLSQISSMVFSSKNMQLEVTIQGVLKVRSPIFISL